MTYAWQKAIDTFSAKLWRITLKHAKLLGFRSKTGGNFLDAVSNVNLSINISKQS